MIDKDEMKKLIEELNLISYVKPEVVPNIDLYMDQVTTFMDEHLEPTKRFNDDKLLTKTMINNYTKNNLLPSPNKKKYSKEHLYLLIFIYYLKNILSITDISSILNPLTDMFFENKGEISLEEIYKEVVKFENEQAGWVAKDIARKIEDASKKFDDVSDEEQREYLKNFAYICMLSYDVYVKRQLIIKLIDEKLVPASEEKNKNTKKQKDNKQEEETN